MGVPLRKPEPVDSGFDIFQPVRYLSVLGAYVLITAGTGTGVILALLFLRWRGV